MPSPEKTGPQKPATQDVTPYQPSHPVRIVTSAALFDGHDASINIMRRVLQATGAEVIHLGHNRSVEEVVNAAIQEDAQGIAISSYQGGHMEYLTYMREMLNERGAEHIKIFAGGGGVIVQREIEELHARGVDRVFSPEDGRTHGLQGMINMVLKGCDFDPTQIALSKNGASPGQLKLARRITTAELGSEGGNGTRSTSEEGQIPRTPVVGITGTGGAGKSSLTDELVRRFVHDFQDKTIAVVCVDPTRRRTGGALLGDRIRFNSLKNPRVYMRSLATRGARGEVSAAVEDVLEVVTTSGFDLVFLETAGIGQGDNAVVETSDFTLYVMTSEFGAPSQLEKIEMLDYADFVAINKFTRRGSEDALRDVRKQVIRNREAFGTDPASLPIFGTSAAHFNDSGVNALYAHMVQTISEKLDLGWESTYSADEARTTDSSQHIIPAGRERYLAEISESCRDYRAWALEQAEIAGDLDALQRSIALLGDDDQSHEPWAAFDGESIAHANSSKGSLADLMEEANRTLEQLAPRSLEILREWDDWRARYAADVFSYEVRGREIRVDSFRETLSESQVPKVALPRFRGAADRLFWRLTENVPGEFPFTAGVFPFKRQAEDPTRMFAGEGPSERTNARFHYLAAGQPAKRLSTAFDSITLYGEDPDERPDIYGKIGESGVAVFTVEEAERLYAGFDLCAPTTSVSMTINGPAPTILAFFFNTAVRQRCRRFLKDRGRLDITDEQVLQPDVLRGSTWSAVRSLLSDDEFSQLREEALARARGTVQADILKEDQGQNTCIFSTEFSLRLMGDVQQYFIDHKVRNFYSVSISGYHIAEAGANPIHQLAFTLANGFTYVEYYLSRGMDLDAFAPSLSYFFSNGMDAEYSVIGRVARRIWAVAMERLYGGSSRSQKLKYHIQTSGRSLHAMEIDFNDIRTTLQALLATYDNAQSLHTNAYDEAITTPTEESVRRAMAIQLIINKEFGLVFCENASQGAFIIDELTDLVEEAVLKEFDSLTQRGGVLGAMELQYQRGVIQEDSLKYETLKHNGELPVIGVNTFLSKDPSVGQIPKDVALTRASTEEKNLCIRRLREFQSLHSDEATRQLARLQKAALAGDNLFGALMEAVEHCSLGQVTHALYEVGGEYRRNL